MRTTVKQTVREPFFIEFPFLVHPNINVRLKDRLFHPKNRIFCTTKKIYIVNIYPTPILRYISFCNFPI